MMTATKQLSAMTRKRAVSDEYLQVPWKRSRTAAMTTHQNESLQKDNSMQAGDLEGILADALFLLNDDGFRYETDQSSPDVHQSDPLLDDIDPMTHQLLLNVCDPSTEKDELNTLVSDDESSQASASMRTSSSNQEVNAMNTGCIFDLFRKLEENEHPTLLTLTSFPYRVVHANSQFSEVLGNSGESIIGMPFFYLQGNRRLALSSCPSFEQQFDGKVFQMKFEGQNEWVYCRAEPVLMPSTQTTATKYGNNSDSGTASPTLGYYAVTLKKVARSQSVQVQNDESTCLTVIPANPGELSP